MNTQHLQDVTVPAWRGSSGSLLVSLGVGWCRLGVVWFLFGFCLVFVWFCVCFCAFFVRFFVWWLFGFLFGCLLFVWVFAFCFVLFCFVLFCFVLFCFVFFRVVRCCSVLFGRQEESQGGKAKRLLAPLAPRECGRTQGLLGWARAAQGKVVVRNRPLSVTATSRTRNTARAARRR